MIRSIIHRCKIIPNAFIQIGLIWILFNFFGKINLNPFQKHCAWSFSTKIVGYVINVSARELSG